MPVFRNQSYAAFLFDMDGTLLDSAAVVRRVWAAWATKHGVHVPTLLAAMHGVRAEDTVRRFAGEGLDIPAEIEWIHEAELGDVDGLVPMEGIGELLARLREEEWAVVTSATLQLATVRIRAARLPMPRVIVTADDVSRGKPDPEGFLIAAQRLDLAAERCVVIEDAPAGIEAARAAGMRAIAVTTTRPAADLAAADLVVDSLADERVRAFILT